MRYPLLFFILVFCAGIFFSEFVRPAVTVCYFSSLILLLLCFLLQKKRLLCQAFITISFFLFGILILAVNRQLPPDHILNIVRHIHQKDCRVSGFVADEPSCGIYGSSFVFKTRSIRCGNKEFSCCGDILVYKGTPGNIYYGESLVLKGLISRANFKDAKGYACYLANRGIYLTLKVTQPESIKHLGKKEGCWIKGFAISLKTKLSGIINNHLSPVSASILEAMVLGEKSRIPSNIYRNMMKAGTVHILVVSGFNVGIVVYALGIVLKLVRLPRTTRILLSIPLVLLYCLVVGSANPVVRATITSIALLASFLLKREGEVLNSTAIAAFLILITNPSQLFDPSFDLSFASLLSILLLYPIVRRSLKAQDIKAAVLRYPVESCLVSACAWLGTSGLILRYFRILSPVTVLANLFIVPLATLITLCGFSMILFSFISSCLSFSFAPVIEVCCRLLVQINVWLLGLPGAYFSFG